MKKLIGFMFVLAIIGLASNMAMAKEKLYPYDPGQYAETVSVTVEAVDKMKKGEFIKLYFPKFKSCDDKSFNLGLLKPKAVFAKGVKSLELQLPVGEAVPLTFANKGVKTTFTYIECTYILKLNLESGKRYKVSINNRSSEDKEFGGFGCDAKVYEVADGDSTTLLPTVPYEPLSCPD